MKVIVRFTPARWDAFSGYLMPKLPGAIPIIDDGRGAMQTFLQALEEAGDSPALILEDDIVLTRNFYSKASRAIQQRPEQIIQFFSRSVRDWSLGTRKKAGSTFSMNQCTYFPAFVCPRIRAFYETWPAREENPTGYDIMIADFLADRSWGYWVHVPSLVEHRQVVSEINPRRSSKRQSTTFHDPDTRGLT